MAKAIDTIMIGLTVGFAFGSCKNGDISLDTMFLVLIIGVVGIAINGNICEGKVK